MTTYTIPSAVEPTGADLWNVAPDLVNGLKLIEGSDSYIVGNLALSEGRSPHRAVNGAVDAIDYQLLAKAGLLLAAEHVQSAISVTVGFPYAMYHGNRDAAIDFLSGVRTIQYDSRTYGGRGIKSVDIEISRVEVLPEIVGCIVALRRGPQRRQGSFFVASLGYGTFEAALCTPGGLVQRTALSTNGARYAAQLVRTELMQVHRLGIRTDRHIDEAMRNGSIIVQRRRLDLSDIRGRALRNYYDSVISPALKNGWSDEDFEKADGIVLAGGATQYPELIDMFTEEFGDIMSVELADDPVTLASRGYCLRSAQIAGGETDAAIGLDIGNAHTVVSLFEDRPSTDTFPMDAEDTNDYDE